MTAGLTPTTYVACPFCERVHQDDGPPVRCCGEAKCLPITEQTALDRAFVAAATVLAVLRAKDEPEVDAERAEVEQLARWLAESPSPKAGEQFVLTAIPLVSRLDLTLTARATNNDPAAVLARLKELYPYLAAAS